MEQQPGVWVRLSVNGDNAKVGSLYVWRSFVGENPEVPLKDMKAEGLCTHRNCVTANVRSKDKYGVLACIAYFGTYIIKDDIMYLEFEEPTHPLDWPALQ